jgi:hypothetical protein
MNRHASGDAAHGGSWRTARAGLDPETAGDIIFGLHRHELYLPFRLEAGWDVDRYRASTFAVLRQQLPPDVEWRDRATGSTMGVTSGRAI